MKRKTSTLGSLKLMFMLPLIGLTLTAFAETKCDFVYSDKNQVDHSKRHLKKAKKVQSLAIVRGDAIAIIGYGSNSSKPRPNYNFRGIDITPTVNDTVYAPFDGVVKFALHDSTGTRNFLKLDHSDGRSTTYACLKTFLVSENQKVLAGDPIALIGKTAKSNWAWMHFEYFVKGVQASQEDHSLAFNSQVKEKKGKR